MKRHALVLALLVAAAMVAACTSSSSGSGDTTTTTAESDERSSRGTTDDDADEGTTTTEDGEDDDEPTGSEAAYVDALTDGFAGDGVTDDQARCAAEAAVDAIGVDTFQQNGITPEDLEIENDSFDLGFALTQQQAEDLVDGLDDCVDLRGLVLADMADDDDLTDEQKDCLEREITTEVLKAMMVEIYTASPDDPEAGFEAFARLLEIAQSCGIPLLDSGFETGSD